MSAPCHIHNMLCFGLQAISDDWRIKLATPIFLLIDILLSRQRIARYLFDRFRSPDNLRKVLSVSAALTACSQMSLFSLACLHMLVLFILQA